MKARTLPYFKPKSIHIVSAIVLLWGLSDALVSFYLPIQMQSFLHNLTLFGILFAVSSLVGALADPLIGYASTRFRYISLLLVGLLLSAALTMTATLSFSVVLIIWLMVAWGLYYEFINIGIFSYVSRHHSPREQSSTFGLIYLFENLAYVIGPLVGGYLVSYGGRVMYGLCFIFLILAFALLPKVAALHLRAELPFISYAKPHSYSLRQQLKCFRRVWTYAAVFFVAIFLYNVWDSFVWTLVPIQSIGGNAVFAGLITSVFTIPLALFTGYGGRIADHVGRNATFVIGLLIASLGTMLFGLQRAIVPELITAAIASFGFAFAYPALMGETSKNGQAHQSQLGNIAGVQRLFVNGGFILGPILGGALANALGVQRSFFVLGVCMLLCFIPLVIAMVHFHVRGRIHRSILLEFEM